MDKVYAEKYYAQVQERYPDLSIKQIDNIIKHGLRTFHFVNAYGGDVLIKSNYFTAYVGKLFRRMDIFYKYRNIKWRIRLRLRYKWKRTIFNGKYYFGMSKEQYDKIFSKKNKSGRKKTTAYFDKVTIYKVYEEALLGLPDYIFEVDHEVDGKFSINYEKKTLRNIRLIAKKNKDGKIEPVSEEKSNETKRK